MPHHTAGGAAAAAAAYVPVLMVCLPASLGKAALCSRQEPMRPLSISFLSIADLQVAPGAWVPSEQQQRHGNLLPWLMLPHALSTSAGRAAALSNPIFSLQTQERMTPRSTAAVATAATSSVTATTAAARIARARGSEATGGGTTTVTATTTRAAQGREAQKQQRHTQLQPTSDTTACASAAAYADPSAQRHKHGQRAPDSASSAALTTPAAAAARAAGGKEGSLTRCKKQPLLRDVVRTLAARVGFLEQQVAAVQRDIGRGRHQMKEFVIEKVLDLEDELRVIGHRSRQEQVAAAEAAAPHTGVNCARATADGTFAFRHPRSATAAQVVAETVAAEPAAEAVSAEAATPGGERAAGNAAAQVRHGSAATSEENCGSLASAAAWGQDETSVGWCEEETGAAASFKEAERRGNPSSERRGCAHFDAADFSFVCVEGPSAGGAEVDGEGGGATCMSSSSSRTPHSGKKTAAAADFDTIFFGSSPGCTFSSSSEEAAAEQPDAEAAAGTARKAATTEGKPHRTGTSFTTDEGQGTWHKQETDQQKPQPTSQQRQGPQ